MNDTDRREGGWRKEKGKMNGVSDRNEEWASVNTDYPYKTGICGDLLWRKKLYNTIGSDGEDKTYE